jgi:glucose-1-phosphate adenylyltransferase
VILPYADIGRGARLRNVVIDRGVQIPDRTGWWSARIPPLDAKRFRRTERGRRGAA